MTPREKQALDFIKAHSREHGYPPSYDEIADHLGVKSKSGVNRIVVSLEDQGRIRRNNGTKEFKQRCIEIIHAPLEGWVHVGEVAGRLVESILEERIDDNGEGTVVVDAKAFGDLDVALNEVNISASAIRDREQEKK